MPFTSNPRPIQFPLDRTLQPENTTPDETIINNPFSWQTTDNDERITITLDVSLNEFIALSSAIDVGRDIAYGEQSIELWWTWIRGINTMALCDQIAECIENNANVKLALDNHNGGNGGSGGNGGGSGAGAFFPVPSSVDNTTNLIAQAQDCTDDNLYGIAVGIVDTAFQVVNDAYQIIEFATNAAELVAGLSDNFPAWMSAGLGTALEVGDWIQETAYDGFAAYDTLTTRTELACEIYCIMKENGCAITYDDLAGFFISRAAITMFTNTLDTIGDAITLLTTADEIGTSSLAVMFATLNVGARFGGIAGASSFFIIVNSFLDEFDPSWSNCDPCGLETFCKNQDLGSSSGVGFGTGLQWAGNSSIQSFGIRGGLAPQGFKQTTAWVEFPSAVTITDFRMRAFYANGGSGGNWQSYVAVFSDEARTQLIQEWRFDSGSAGYFSNQQSDINVANVRGMEFQARTPNNGDNQIVDIDIAGIGVSPLGTDNC